MSTINVSNLVAELRKKIEASLSEEDILYYTKAIQQLRTGNVFVVSYVSNLPAPSTVLGSLYYVNETEILYIATAYGWIEIYNSTFNAIFSWGQSGYLGNGIVGNSCSPVREFCSAIDWCQVSAGRYGTLAIKTSGELWAWGGYSANGDGTTTPRCSPVREFCSATNWCQASRGCLHSVALKTSGEIWAWGCNRCGQFGDGTYTTTCSPVREFCSATDWCQVSTNEFHTHAIKTSGQLWSWGEGDCGALINNSGFNNSSSPIREFCSAADWCQVSAGGRFGGAVKTNGQLFAWGKNNCGQTGNGTTTPSCSPAREICSATDWCQVSASSFGTISAIKTTGELWAWGSGLCGQLAIGLVTGSSCSPVREFCSATNWCLVSSGSQHTAAIKTSGELWAWGGRSSGNLGDGTTTIRCSPVREFCSATDWCQVSAGQYHTVALISKTF